MAIIYPPYVNGYRLPWRSVNARCESELSAHMIEDRALTGKKYESVNGV
jgi:hypothetical protein